MNVTFFNTAPLSFGGGAEIIFMNIIERLSNNGHKVNIITFDKITNEIYSRIIFRYKIEWRLEKDYILKKVGNTNINEISIISLIPCGKSFDRIRHVILNSDVIYTKNEIQELIILNYFLKLCGKNPPVVCGIHTPIIYPCAGSFLSKIHNILYQSFIYKKLLKKCTIVLPQNKYDNQLLTSKYGIRIHKVINVLPFIDIKFFHPIDIKIDSKFKILFAGRLTEQKGIDVLCSAIEYLSKLPEFEDMIFTIAGSGELCYMIEDMKKRYDNIKFLGFIPGEKLVELYNSHDVVVLPSRWETTLKVVLEAQACGLPVIVSDIPGPNELIIPNETGFLIKPEDYKDLSEKILRIYQLKIYKIDKYLKMRKGSTKNAEKYSMDILMKQLERVLYACIKKDENI